MNRREPKAYALGLLATRAEELADPLLGDDAMSDEDNDKVGAALNEIADELSRRSDRLGERTPAQQARVVSCGVSTQENP